MSDEKIAQLKQQVLASPVLSLQERQEWLLMLPLMNDKQQADLETILRAPVKSPQPMPTSVPPVSSPQQMPKAQAPVAAPPLQPRTSFVPPKLTHIANIPPVVEAKRESQSFSGNSAPVSGNQAPSSNRPQTKLAWDKEIQRELSEPELPAPKQNLVVPLQPKPAQADLSAGPKLGPIVAKLQAVTQPQPSIVSPPKVSSVSTQPLVSAITSAAAPTPVGGLPTPPPPPRPPSPNQKPELEPKPSTTPRDDFWSALLEPKRAQSYMPATLSKAAARVTGPVITAIVSPADISLLSIESLREMSPKLIIDSIQKMVRDQGYDTILALFERSPLYEAYLAGGSMALEKNMTFEQYAEAKTDKDLPLSRSEFEMIADVLKNIQVN